MFIIAAHVQNELELSSAEGEVAFYAHRSDGSHSITAGSIMIFDQVVTNLGNGYSTASGSFTAFVSGYYSFTLFHQNSGDTDSNLAIMVNDISVCFSPAAYFDQGSCTVNVELQPGDVVNVKATSSSTISSNGKGTGFSGSLYLALQAIKVHKLVVGLCCTLILDFAFSWRRDKNASQLRVPTLVSIFTIFNRNL